MKTSQKMSSGLFSEPEEKKLPIDPIFSKWDSFKKKDPIKNIS